MEAEKRTTAVVSAGDLKQIPVFRGLSEATLQSLAAISHPEAYDEGQVLFEEGQEGDSLYIVLEGSAVIQKVIDREAGTFKDLAVIEEGDLLGEMSLFDNQPRSATVRAFTNLRVLRVFREEFEAFLKQDVGTAAVVLGSIVALMSHRLRESGLHVATLYEIGNLISRSTNPAVLAHGVIERLCAAIPQVNVAAFCTWQSYQDDSEIVASIGVPGDDEQALVVSRGGPVYQHLRAHPAPFIMPDLEEDHPLRKALSIAPGDALLVVPLYHLDDVLGFILLLRHQVPFTAFHKVLASATATQVGSALKNLMHAKEAEARSRLEAAKANPLGASW